MHHDDQVLPPGADPPGYLALRRSTWIVALVWSAIWVAVVIGSWLADPLVHSPAVPLGQGLLWLSGISAIILTGYGLARRLVDGPRLTRGFRAAGRVYRRLFEAARAGVMATDSQGRLVMVNGLLAEMLGYSAGELLHRPAVELIYQPDRAAFHQQAARGREGHSAACEFRVLCKDGRPLWVLASVSPVFDACGRNRGLLGMLIDIDARKRHELELSDYAAALEEALRALGESGLGANLQTTIPTRRLEGAAWPDHPADAWRRAPGAAP